MSTIGNTSTPTSEDGTGAYSLAISFTMPAGGGTLTKLSMYCRNSLAANNVVISLFQDDGAGKPGVKIADTGSLVETVGGAANGTLTEGSAAASLVAGTIYWIVGGNTSAAGDHDNHKMGLITGGSFLYRSGNGIPADNTWNTGDFGTHSGDTPCMYATYTPSGGGTSVTTRIPLARAVPMRPGPGGFTRGNPVTQSRANPAQAGIALADVGALTLTGLAPTATSSNNQGVTPGVGVLQLDGFAPTTSVQITYPPRALQMNIPMRPTAGGLSVGNPVTQSRATPAAVASVVPNVGALVLTGLAPTVTSGSGAVPGLGGLVLTGLAPTVSSSNNQNTFAGVGVLTLSGFAPSVFTPRVVTPSVGVLALTGLAPDVTVSAGNALAAPGSGALLLAGLAPSVVATDDNHVGRGVLLADPAARARRALFKSGPA